MTNTSLCRAGLLALLVVVSASCSDTKPPTTPTPLTPTSPPVPVPSDPFPGAGIYEFAESPSGRPVQPYTSDSRYVLDDNGTFGLQLGNFEYRGSYQKADGGGITFEFARDSRATGVFDGNRMIVSYNLNMLMSDFEDGVYVLKPSAATD